MPAKHDDSRTPRKAKPAVPSSGRGAASAMDALIKRRVTPPEPADAPPPVRPKKPH